MIVALLRLLLPVALIANPVLLAWCMPRHVSPILRLASIGPLAIALNTLAPVALHLAGAPVASRWLATVHGALCVVLLGSAVWLDRRRKALGTGAKHGDASPAIPWRSLAPVMILFAVLTLPVTPIAGIDTYKWQDLATNVAVERAIPWLVHPASLFGFTPRAYPSAQPLVLASIQILGHTGVAWGFYLVSLLVGFTAITGAYALARRLSDKPDLAWWCSFLYAFSPLLMRYGYWATGRGFLLALLPLFVRLLLDARRPRVLLSAVATALLLTLSHKAGLVAVVLIPCATAISPALALGRSRRHIPLVLAACAAVAGLWLAPSPLAWVARAATRFAWLAPLAIMGWLNAESSQTGERRFILAAALLTLPLAFADDPYGAMLAAPFVAVSAAAGCTALAGRVPATRMAALRACIVGLVLLAAATILIRQGMDSPSRAVVRAAQFLDNHDPYGPYRIEAPGRARMQMQAYVSGCPRFSVTAPTDTRLTVRPPPPLTGQPRDDLHRWTAWLRSWLEIPDVETAWYGAAPRVYYVIIDSQGTAPAGAKSIYVRDGVEILTAP